jgi:hypothetical protein
MNLRTITHPIFNLADYSYISNFNIVDNTLVGKDDFCIFVYGKNTNAVGSVSQPWMVTQGFQYHQVAHWDPHPTYDFNDSIVWNFQVPITPDTLPPPNPIPFVDTWEHQFIFEQTYASLVCTYNEYNAGVLGFTDTASPAHNAVDIYIDVVVGLDKGIIANGIPTHHYDVTFSATVKKSSDHTVLYSINHTTDRISPYPVEVFDTSANVSETTLTVISENLSSYTIPVITSQPSNVTAFETDLVTFSIEATGLNPPLTYQWYKNGSIISGATNSTLSFPAITSDSGSTYYCIVGDQSTATNSDVWVQSNTVTLTVDDLIITPPSDATGFVGQEVGFSVTLNPASTSTYNYSWLKNGIIDHVYEDHYQFFLNNGDATATVDVTNKKTGIQLSSSANITVNNPISVNPIAETRPMGATTNFSIGLYSDASAIGYRFQWLQDNTLQSWSTSSVYNEEVKLSDNGSQWTGRVVAINNDATAISTSALLTVERLIGTDLTDATCYVGQVPNFGIGLQSDASYQPIAYEWYKNGKQVQDNETSTYVNYADGADDNALIQCLVYNNHAVDPSVKVRLHVLPLITNALSNQTVTYSQQASFSVTTANSPSIQWYKNNLPILGATSATYSFYPTLDDNQAQIYCRASANGHYTQTNTVILTVNPLIIGQAGT